MADVPPSKVLPRNVKVLGGASLLNDVASEMIFPLLPNFLLMVLSGNRFYLGVIEGAADSVASLLKLWSGGRSDQAGRRKGFVLFGYSLGSLGFVPELRPLLRPNRACGEDLGGEPRRRRSQGAGLRLVQLRHRDCHAAGEPDLRSAVSGLRSVGGVRLGSGPGVSGRGLIDARERTSQMKGIERREEPDMTSIGNHMKFNVHSSLRERVRSFYVDALQCTTIPSPAENLDLFLFAGGFVLGVFFCDQTEVLSEEDHLKSAWLEIKANDVEEVKRRLVDFGVKEVDYPDTNRFYFQAPGGQVFRQSARIGSPDRPILNP